jgi:hypothetical protein
MSDGTAEDFINAVGSSFGDVTLSIDNDGKILADSTGLQMIGPFPFCVTFRNREVATMNIMAPSPEEAARTVSDMVNAANTSMPGWNAFAGTCPSGV